MSSFSIRNCYSTSRYVVSRCLYGTTSPANLKATVQNTVFSLLLLVPFYFQSTPNKSFNHRYRNRAVDHVTSSTYALFPHLGKVVSCLLQLVVQLVLAWDSFIYILQILLLTKIRKDMHSLSCGTRPGVGCLTKELIRYYMYDFAMIRSAFLCTGQVR